MNHWSEIAEQLRQQIEQSHQAREAGLHACRKATQLCARAIRSLHRHEFEICRALLTEAHREINHARELLRPFPSIYYAGFLHDAEKEYVEGEILYAIVLGDSLPEPEELAVEIPAYLNGVAEAASECRRYVLDLLRAGELAHAETLLGVMDEIYDELVTFDYPDAVTGGLRRACDALRAVLERTRADLTLTATQKELENTLASVYQALQEREK
ncbi:MAG: haloacid dehalogenase [Fimbriimonadales bacterium]|nr:MAG: haloacid dehalogenase [Fimbriimonadales bacterium]